MEGKRKRRTAGPPAKPCMALRRPRRIHVLRPGE
ncbi:hypothetical protein DGI_2384 [Megalodesulfovibrio gigas DSM 1382 = ATCC 19364]|uniref:Uncharacterized protein n=1 Tax=Megalodesulfovibrio gigas (strain ATCC 19364 / DSM 1382 / NCIMB 9332 / VKM B-1759) TaxID=1121448 RepID=T2GDE8_MEGG1|nr:hypothetical protein DGI_2384 [Megalodesulfovibrio gigas DSM 1382 = ATCC 19364]